MKQKRIAINMKKKVKNIFLGIIQQKTCECLTENLTRNF
jgi:hypothetical protein